MKKPTILTIAAVTAFALTAVVVTAFKPKHKTPDLCYPTQGLVVQNNKYTIRNGWVTVTPSKIPGFYEAARWSTSRPEGSIRLEGRPIDQTLGHNKAIPGEDGILFLAWNHIPISEDTYWPLLKD